MFKFRQNGLKEQDGERITINDEMTERNDEVTVKKIWIDNSICHLTLKDRAIIKHPMGG